MLFPHNHSLLACETLKGAYTPYVETSAQRKYHRVLYGGQERNLTKRSCCKRWEIGRQGIAWHLHRLMLAPASATAEHKPERGFEALSIRLLYSSETFDTIERRRGIQFAD